MATRNSDTIYNRIHNNIELKDVVYNIEKRTIEIVINKDYDNTLFIKIRDVNSYLFSYTFSINRTSFLQMKREQSLDIDFDEFETHLLEMLKLNLSNEMLLKCEITQDGAKCRLIFYEKSRIKDLIFLVIDLTVTDQKEVFIEMENNFKFLQETNKNLSRQVKCANDNLREKEHEISRQNSMIKQLKIKFLKDVEEISESFTLNLCKVETVLVEKLLKMSCKILKVSEDVCVVKRENNLKSESNSRLLQKICKMNEEIVKNETEVRKLELECERREKNSRNLENELFQLSITKNEYEKKLSELENKMDEYRRDLESSAVIIADKTELYNELKRDMEQASQVIKNYNKHCDAKAREVDELKDAMQCKDALIKEQIMQNNKMFKEFQEYKLHFNKESNEKLLDELEEAEKKLEGLEKEKRELVKLNELLTKRLQPTTAWPTWNENR